MTEENMDVELDGLFKQNKSYDYYDYEIPEVSCESSTVTGALGVFIPLLYSFGLLWGLLGNGLVLVILWRKRLKHRVMDIFILHLCLADSLLLLTLPLWAVDAVKGWIMGTRLCKLAGALFKINFYCGIFLLFCFSVDSYQSIVRDRKMLLDRKPLVIHCCFLVIWLLCLLLSIPDWIYLKSKPQSKIMECFHYYHPDSYRLASRLPYIMSFVLAAFVLLICFSILLKLWQDSRCQKKKTDRRTAVTAALALFFFIFWTPYSIAFIVGTARPVEIISASSEENECDGRQWTAIKITAVFGLLHCVINPVIYFSLSKEFRRRTLTMLKLSPCETNSNNDGSLWDSSENSSIQEEQGSHQPTSSEMQTLHHDL